jgi:hypothetical protein
VESKHIDRGSPDLGAGDRRRSGLVRAVQRPQRPFAAAGQRQVGLEHSAQRRQVDGPLRQRITRARPPPSENRTQAQPHERTLLWAVSTASSNSNKLS